MSKEAMKLALELLKSAHVSTDLVWKRHDCVQALEEALALKQECVYTNDTSEERVAQTRENVHEPEWYHVIDVHGCNRFYHRTEDCPYKVKTPLYTTPQQRKPLTDEQADKIIEQVEDMVSSTPYAWDLVPPKNLVRAILKAAHGIK